MYQHAALAHAPSYAAPRRLPHQAWFDATIRTDVTAGINTRERLRQHDPGLAAMMRRAYGDGPWRWVQGRRVGRVAVHSRQGNGAGSQWCLLGGSGLVA